MKQIILLFFAAFCTILLFQNNSTGALPENTGAPGELTCGRAPCHNIPANTGDANVAITFEEGDTTYTPGQTHAVTISIADSDRIRRGFEILALDAQNNNVGTWKLTDTDIMQIKSGIGLPERQYVTHKLEGTQQAAWTVNWEAPEADMGKVTFYSSVLDANNDGTNSNDELYTTSLEIAEGIISSIKPILSEKNISIFPNPTQDHAFIHLPEEEVLQEVLIYNAQGKLMQRSSDNPIGLHNLPKGIYYLLVQTNIGHITQKVLLE